MDFEELENLYNKNQLSDYLAYKEPKESTYNIFQRNKEEMEKAGVKYADKFFHARANCEAGQNGAVVTPIMLDFLKEDYDLFKKIIYPRNGKPWRMDILDSIEDLGADSYGLYRGLTNNDRDCSTLLDKYKVRGLEDY